MDWPSVLLSVLVVAATNRDLDEKVDGKHVFRRDLLARFTDRNVYRHFVTVMEDLSSFILDCSSSAGFDESGRSVQEIGQQALDYLKSKTFEDGSFRELEDLFRAACHRSAAQHYRATTAENDFKERM